MNIAVQLKPVLTEAPLLSDLPKPFDGNEEDVQAHYCITRSDLPHGVQAAQLIHAAGESSPGNLSTGTYAFALVVDDELALRELALKLFMAGITHKMILEPDAPWNGQLMAIGVCPAPRKKIKKYFKGLKLLG